MFLLILEAISTAYLTGLIWTVQRVHYPSFKYIENKSYKDFQVFHMQRITYVVGPMMLIELSLGILNLIKLNFPALLIINLLLTFIIWTSTVFWSVPLHKKLLETKSISNITELIKSNLLRSIIWTIKLSILILFLYKKY